MMSNRELFLVGFLTCFVLIMIALYFQHIEGLAPCLLCFFQRLAFITMGIFFLIGFIRNPQNLEKKVLGILIMLSGILGISIAGRHVWLQNLPPGQVPECSLGLEFMWENFSLQELLETVLRGNGECAEIAWMLFGITMPKWSFIWLLILTFLSFFILFRRES